jgi:ABC-type dipeptide/oligopeptide/nickel transport system permease component
VRARRRRAAAVALVRLVTRDFGVLIGLSVFVEIFFGLPGLGVTLYMSVYPFDYPLGEAIDAPIGEGVLLTAALLAVGVQLAVDLVLAAVLLEARPT